MLAFLINLIIVLLVGGLLYWLAETVLTLVPLPSPVKQIVHILIVIAFVVWIIGLLTGSFTPLYVGNRL